MFILVNFSYLFFFIKLINYNYNKFSSNICERHFEMEKSADIFDKDILMFLLRSIIIFLPVDYKIE